MYIHIGDDLNIRSKEIIAILDKASVISSDFAEEFLGHYEKKKIINLTKKNFKSVIITEDNVYLSPVASGTLKKRSNKKDMQEF